MRKNRPARQERRRRRRLRKILVLASAATLFILAGLLAVVLTPDKPPPPPLHITLAPGEFTQTLWFDGTAEASENVGVQAPSGPYERQLSFLAEEGTLVKKGDVVARFDTTAVINNIEEVEEQKQSTVDEIELIEEDWVIEESMLQTDISKHENSRDIYALDKATLEFAQEYLKDMATLQFSKADVTVSASESRLEGKALQSNQHMDSRKKRSREFERREKKNAKYLAEYEIKAPMDSIVIHRHLWTSHMWKKPEEGEFLSRNAEFMALPDLSSMVIRLQVEERLVDQLRQGAKVTFFPVSAPDSVLRGKIDSIATLAVEGRFNSKRKYFEVTVEIDKSSEALRQQAADLLKPGMIVRAQVECQHWSDVLAIPLEFAESTEEGIRVKQWQADPGNLRNRELVDVERLPDYYLVKSASNNLAATFAASGSVAVAPPDATLPPTGWLASFLHTIRQTLLTPRTSTASVDDTGAS